MAWRLRSVFDTTQGRINQLIQPFAELAEQGILSVNYGVVPGDSAKPISVWDMVEEHSTGYSGAFARQATLNHITVEANNF